MAHFTCEVVYRGIFQKNLAARICRGIVLSARKAGRWGIAFGRYGDSPQRNGIPAKDFAIVADTQEELEQNMARYEPKEVDVTICVDDTLSKGVESWAWYGLQPINRLTVSGGTLLMTSLQNPAQLLKDIHKKDAPYNLALIRAKASFSGLWVYKEDHTEARILGALAKIQPDFLSLDAVCQAIKEAEWGSDLKAASARKAHERLETQPIKITEGNAETPFSFEKPKWWEMREGVTIPAIPIGKPMEGGKGYVPERNPYFKKFTTRTMRPVIDFDKCVKCTLCWIQCPDSCFDVTPDGLYDANMESCCGCGVCEAVCPAKDCVTMVREDAFEDNASQWEMWRTDKATYKTWMTDKIHSKEHITRSHGFRFRGQYEEEIKKELESGGIEITAGIPGENAESKQVGRRQTMAVETKPAGAVADHKEMLISGSEACAEALTLADLDVVTAYPIRPYDTVMQAIAKKIANGQLVAEYIVAEGEHSQFEIVKHASTVGARVFCGSSGVGWMYAMECLTVTPAAARADGVHGRQPGARRPGRLRRRAQRRAGRPRPRLVADLGGHRPGDARHDAARLPHRRGPARVPAHRDLRGRRLPHALPDDLSGAEPGPGGQVPAALRPGRPAAAPGQPDHGGAPGQRGLGHRDPAAERRGDEAGQRRDRGGLRRLPEGHGPRHPRTRGSRST